MWSSSNHSGEVAEEIDCSRVSKDGKREAIDSLLEPQQTLGMLEISSAARRGGRRVDIVNRALAAIRTGDVASCLSHLSVCLSLVYCGKTTY